MMSEVEHNGGYMLCVLPKRQDGRLLLTPFEKKTGLQTSITWLMVLNRQVSIAQDDCRKTYSQRTPTLRMKTDVLGKTL